MSSKTNDRYDLMRGKIRVEKESTSNIVRVFVSSTFVDMTDERNVLYAHAYPELRNFCQNLGLEFQVIDMRWGVRDTASVNHSTSALCLLEVETCKKVSLGPYFAIFFGDRYGYQPLPTSIPDTEFTNLRQIAVELKMDKQGLLEKWYKLDTNSIPHARILERITTHLPHFDDVIPEFKEQKETDIKEWEMIFNNLSSILKSTSNIAVIRGLIGRDFQQSFSKSITQLEIEEALKGKSEGVFLAYNREISDLHKHTTDEKAGMYIDMLDEGKGINKERQKLLKALKKTVRQHTEKKNAFKRYDITWNSLKNAHNESQTTKREKNYLSTLSNDFVSDVKRSILKCMAEKMNSNKTESLDDSLLQEVIHHAYFEAKRTTVFCGRGQFIDEISTLINDPKNNHPIVLVGSSGSGKTSLMAKLVENERMKTLGANIVYRFLGTSPDSSNIHKLLTSLILQISTAYGEDLPPSYKLQNYADVVELFPQLLKKVSNVIQKKGEGPLILFLDSIDQLSLEDGAHRMTWLPKTSPNKVTVIISSLPEPDFGIVPAMRRHIPESNILTVQGLNVETANEILEKCLGDENRCLNESQTSKILQAFEKSPYPLFLKLMLDQAKRWRSHDNVDNLILAETSREAISQFYDRLEKDHGKTFVSRAIGYIVATRDGVTENELQDLLSLDDDVMFDVYEHWSPPSETAARIPSFAWTRLNYDLGKYLVQRQATGHTVLALYHRQFIEVARQRYLHKSVSVIVYSNLSEYFSGLYGGGKAKKLKLKMWGTAREVDRGAAKQPLQFSNEVFNLRKLRELPYCLLRAEQCDELRFQVLANALWIKTKIKAFSIKELLEDYELFLQEKSDIEIRLISDSIKLAKPTLEFPAGVRNHVFTELYCRLKFFTAEFPQLANLVSQCHEHLEEMDDELLLPLTGNFQPPGGPLRTTITGFHKPVTFLKFSTMDNVFAVASSEGSLMIWDTINDEVVHRIDAHTDAITCITFTEFEGGNKVATCSRDKTLKIFHLDNGNMCFNATVPELEATEFAKLILTEDNLFCITDFKTLVWDIVTKKIEYEKKFESAITNTKSIVLNGKRHVVVGQKDGKCLRFDVEKGEENGTVDHPSTSSRVADILDFNEAEHHVLIVWKDGCMTLLNSNTFAVEDAYSSNRKDVTDTAKSRNGALVAVAFSDAVEVYSTNKGKIEQIHILDDHSAAITKVRFMDYQTMAVASKNEIVTLWGQMNGEKYRIINTWEGMGASIDHIEIGEKIGVTASFKTFYLKVWDLRHEDVVQPQPAMSLTLSDISPKGDYIVYAKGSNLVVKKVSNFLSEENCTSKLHEFIVPDIDARNCKSVHFDNEQHLMVLKNDNTIKHLSNPLSHDGNLANEKETTYCCKDDHVSHMHISNRGAPICIVIKSRGAKKTSSILLVDTNDLNIISKIHLEECNIEGDITVVCVIGTSDNAIVLGTTSGSIYLFNTANGEYQKTLLSSKHQSAITCLAVNDNEDLLFSGSKGRTRRLWSLRNNNGTFKHDLHFKSLLEGGVTCAQFSHDGNYLFTGSKERSITIWDVHTGAMVGAQYVYAPVINLVMKEDGHLIYTSELGYLGVAKFRAPNKHARIRVKSGRNLSNKSSTCIIM